MGDSDRDSKTGVPAWQNAKTNDSISTSRAETGTEQAVKQAKKFLQDAEVQKASRDQKIEFLKSKGIEEKTIILLLDGENNGEHPPKTPTEAGEHAENESDTTTRTLREATSTAGPREERPPIITYPEFLTKPARPPPLVTANGFLNTLYAFGGLSALIYGSSQYVLAPMVDSLTDARSALYDTARQNLGGLVEKLEGAVSEIPPTRRGSFTSHIYGDDESSEYDDPTEMFHRDIGVQTSLPPTPVEATSTPTETPSARQSRRLRELVASAKAVNEGLTSQSESHADVKALLDVFKDELYRMGLPTHDFSGGSSFYSGFNNGNSNSNNNRNEADDEIKKAKENIRRVKGVLLSARSFPTGTR